MPSKQFDPRKFIDRDFEQELFEELLQPNDEARILAITDAGGMGKSQLLQQFQYRCRRAVRPSIPISLVALDQLPDDSRLALVQQIERDLSAFSLEFPTFTHRENARKAYDFTTIRGSVDLRGADMRESEVKAAGTMYNIGQVGQISGGTPPTFTPEQQATAQRRSVEAFFQDLANYCNRQPVVIMLDAYEKCDPALQTWILDHFLEPYCFNFEQRPAHLLLVIAGQATPDFEMQWPLEFEAVVKSVKSLTQWTAGHVEECLQVHGFSYDQEQLDTLCRLIKFGLPPSEVVKVMRLILPSRAR